MEANECCDTVIQAIDGLLSAETTPFQKMRIVRYLSDITRPEVAARLLKETNRVMAGRDEECHTHHAIRQAMGDYRQANSVLQKASAFSRLVNYVKKDGSSTFAHGI